MAIIELVNKPRQVQFLQEYVFNRNYHYWIGIRTPWKYTDLVQFVDRFLETHADQGQIVNKPYEIKAIRNGNQEPRKWNICKQTLWTNIKEAYPWFSALFYTAVYVTLILGFHQLNQWQWGRRHQLKEDCRKAWASFNWKTCSQRKLLCLATRFIWRVLPLMIPEWEVGRRKIVKKHEQNILYGCIKPKSIHYISCPS